MECLFNWGAGDQASANAAYVPSLELNLLYVQSNFVHNYQLLTLPQDPGHYEERRYV